MTDEERLDFIQENRFARMLFLQHAQLHLMKPEDDGDLHVRLDGDYAAILRLQSAESNVMEQAMSEAWDSGYDKAAGYCRETTAI